MVARGHLVTGPHACRRLGEHADASLSTGFEGLARRRRQRQHRQAHRGIGPGVETKGVGARVEAVDAGPLERVLGFEERGPAVECDRQVEGPLVEQDVDGHRAEARAMHFGDAVHRPNTRFELVEPALGDEVGLVEHDDVGERDLFLGLAAAPELLVDMDGVDDGDDAVERVLGGDVVVHEERLCDRPGVGEARGLDQHVVELVAPLAEVGEHPDQIASHGAADAPIGHLEDFFVGVDHQALVDADLAELVLDDRDASAMVLGEDAVEQRRLAGPEEAGEDRDRYAAHRATPPRSVSRSWSSWASPCSAMTVVDMAGCLRGG